MDGQVLAAQVTRVEGSLAEMIVIEGLAFAFGHRGYALRDVSLTIQAGEFLVVTGPSGCGKSTSALAIGGYLFRQYDGEARAP